MSAPRVRSMLACGLRFKEIRLLVAWVALSAAFVAWVGEPARSLVHAVVAVIAWGGLEYGIHRFVLHATGPVGRVLEQLGLDVHWQHHLDPTRPELVFTPWWASALLVLGAAVVGSISEGLVSAAGAMFGMSLVSVHYETTHLSAHVPYVHRTAYGRFMKRFHLLHHFRSEHCWFGVTHPLADWLAGTWRASDEVPLSPTVRTLGVEVPPIPPGPE